VKHGEIRDAAGALGISLVDSQIDVLDSYETLLRERGITLGLIAGGDAGRIWERHIMDCLRAARIPGRAASGYDLGSGAGLPGIVIAIVRPDLGIGLVEPRLRRAAFLEMAARELELPGVWVEPRAARDLDRRVGFCLARALAPAPESWAMAERLLLPGGRLIYFAGRGSRVPEALPGARSIEALKALLESSGPLVIMTRE